MLELTIFGVMFTLGFIVLFPIFLASQREYRRQDAAAAAAAGQSVPEPQRTSRRVEVAPYAVSQYVAPVQQPIAAPASAPNQTQVLPFGTVWRVLMQAIHVLIVGETHSGKSTSARAVLTGRIQVGDEIVIFDPHSTPITWGGLTAVGAGRDFAAIEQGMQAVLVEMTKRYEQLATNANYEPTPMTIFVDEWPAIQSHCKKIAAQFITELAQEGRKAGMRLVMLTQSDLVASLGIEGKGDVRSNFTMLLLGAKAIARCPEAGELAWPAALRRGEGNARAALTDQMPIYELHLNNSMARPWQPTTPPKNVVARPVLAQQITPDRDPDLDPLWQRFLNGESLLEPEERTGTQPIQGTENPPKSVHEPVHENTVLADTDAVHTGSEQLPDDDLSIAIRVLVQAGMSRNKVLSLLNIPGGRGEQLKRIKQALGEPETAT